MGARLGAFGALVVIIAFWYVVLGILAPRIGIPIVGALTNAAVNNWCANLDCDGWFNTSRPTPAARVGAPVQVAPTATPLPNPQPVATPVPTPRDTNAPQNADANDEAAIEVEADGRIWQPNIKPGNKPYTKTFVAPTSSTWKFMGINATLADSQGTVLAAKVNNKPVTLKKGETYTVRGGSNNGGFSLEVQ